LVSKKLSGFLHSGKIETIEAFILDTILYKDLRKENGGVLCDMETIKTIVHRANTLKIEILGIETRL
jgi:nucleoside phosphorylase